MIDILELLDQCVKFTNYNHWANVYQLDHEVETENLDVFVAVLDAGDDGIDNLALVEAVLFNHVFEKAE